MLKGATSLKKKKMCMDNVLVYNVRSADIKIPDSFMTIILSGSNITIYAYGSQTFVTLWERRITQIENAGKIIKEKNWATPFLEKGMSPYIYGPSLKD